MALNNINAAAMNVTRQKMNSTMMVKFNSSTEKGINLNTRANLNKSTLLPQQVNNHTINTNSRNPNIKMNLNIDQPHGD